MAKAGGQKLGCGGLIALLIVVGLVIAGVKKAAHSVGIGNHPATTAVAAAPTPKALLSLVRSSSDSYCLEQPDQARIFVSIGIRNRGDGAATVNPWASFDYSDGGTSTEDYYNTSASGDLNVPAHSVRVARFYHPYNPQQQSLLRCAGYLDLGDSSATGHFLPLEH